jgi:hypothetical protein
MFPKVAETLINQGFEILKLSETENPVYAVKFDENEHSIFVFLKNMMMILIRSLYLQPFLLVILLMKTARLFTVQKLDFL